jgi:hypothetical protein
VKLAKACKKHILFAIFCVLIHRKLIVSTIFWQENNGGATGRTREDWGGLIPPPILAEVNFLNFVNFVVVVFLG